MKNMFIQILWLSSLALLTSACGGGSSNASVTENQPPLVSAGEPQTVESGDVVELQAEASDSDGSVVGIIWQQTAGTAVELSASDTLSTRFTAPDIATTETLTFSITVTDDDDAAATDSVSILVEPKDTSCRLDSSQIANCTIE